MKTASHIFDVVKSDHDYAKYFVLKKQAQYNPNLPIRIKEKLEQNDVIAKSIITIEEGQRQGMIRKGNTTALAMTL